MSIVTQVDLLKMRRTKIVATVGPASSDPAVLAQLIDAGVNVFRLNMSHGNYDFHTNVYRHIRKLGEEKGTIIAILADLCGPKIRVGTFPGGKIKLESGAAVKVTTRDVEGHAGLIPSQYSGLAGDVKPGDRILLDDGALELKVSAVHGTDVHCKVVQGGVLKDKKGMNLPGVKVSAPSLTEKDRDDAIFALELGVDFLALSFVRRAADIMELRELIWEQNGTAAVIAKIEKPEALAEISRILDVADGIMVARGDLGVELPPEQVPVAQSQLIEMARTKFKPVIVATQMLESMIVSARPTRAEVTDISHAVTLGTDAVMLSAETASGAHPVAAVRMMDRIARQTESYLWRSGHYGTFTAHSLTPPLPIWGVMANATSHMSKDLMARAVLVISQSGMSASTVCSARPAAPVVGITRSPEACRRMALMWSVIPILAQEAGIKNPNALAQRVAQELGLAEKGQYVLLVRGFSSNPELNTPSVTALVV
ncbi:MAG: pyruvate kinase [Gammaproteobacteria bacterium]|nr:pyruvate kinase [Gammaproteobacteria bacterium]